MKFKEELAAGRAGWKLLTLYQKFEHAVILLLTALIAIVVALAVWNLALKVGINIISSGFDPTDYEVFQAFFGMIFTVSRVQALVAGGGGAPARRRAGSHRGPDCAARHRSKADDHRSFQHGCTATARARGGDRGVGRRTLARPGPGQTRRRHDNPKHCTLDIGGFAMTIHKLEKAEWRPFLDLVSKVLPAKQAEIEVASLKLGDQVEAEWLPLLGLAYDPNDDIVEVALDGLDHMIPRPRELYIDNGIGSLSSLEIIDADGVKQIVKLRDPLMLPPPRT